jgi:hypothetical protein
VFVVGLAGVQAVVKLAEEFVEQVALGLAVPVFGRAAGIEVATGTGRAAQRGQCPNGAGRGEPLVFDMPVSPSGPRVFEWRSAATMWSGTPGT